MHILRTALTLSLLLLLPACHSYAVDGSVKGEVHANASADTEQAGWIDLFNGKDLTGWTNPYEWGEAKVVDGVIELTAGRKFFLTTEQQFSDFEFEAQIMLPKEGEANSGIMYRCYVKKNKVFGYQAECDPTERGWSGGLFDEGRRKWIYPTKTPEGYKIKLVQAPRGEWMSYRIKCVGNHLQVWVDGKQTLDIQDEVDAKGHFGLQHHGEKGQTYRFRNIRVRPIEAESQAKATPAE